MRYAVDRSPFGEEAHASKLRERFDTSTAAGRFIFHVFASLTQFDRELIRERTKTAAVKTLWASKEHTGREIGLQFGVPKNTIDRIVRPQRIGTPKVAETKKLPSKRIERDNSKKKGKR